MINEMEAKAKNCRLAMKAAIEAIQDYCGTGGPEHGRYIRFAGEIIEYPESVQDIMADPELSGEEQVKAIAETTWAEETAKEQCKGMYGEELPAFDECIKWMSVDLARAVLFQRLKRVIEGVK